MRHHDYTDHMAGYNICNIAKQVEGDRSRPHTLRINTFLKHYSLILVNYVLSNISIMLF